MFDKDIKRHLKLTLVLLLLLALLGPYLGLHLVSSGVARRIENRDPDQPLPLHNPLPIPDGLKRMGQDRTASTVSPPAGLSAIENLLDKNEAEKQAAGRDSDGQN